MTDVLHVDHYPRSWLADVSDLTVEERGMLATAENLICATGGPITPDHLRKNCPCHGRLFNRVLARLLDLEKLHEKDGKLHRSWCETSLKNARKRIETSQKNGQNGGRPSGKNKEIEKPTGSPSRARQHQHQHQHQHQQYFRY